jgi:hypothetical protein
MDTEEVRRNMTPLPREEPWRTAGNPQSAIRNPQSAIRNPFSIPRRRLGREPAGVSRLPHCCVLRRPLAAAGFRAYPVAEVIEVGVGDSRTRPASTSAAKRPTPRSQPFFEGPISHSRASPTNSLPLSRTARRSG